MKKALRFIPEITSPAFRYILLIGFAALWGLPLAGAAPCNSAGASGEIALADSTLIHIPGWFYPGDPIIDSIELLTPGPGFVAFAYSDQVFTAACNGQVVRTLRNHNFIDWLVFDPGAPPVVLPALDLDNDGRTGDAYDIAIVGDSVWLVQGGQLTTAIAPSTNGVYDYQQVIRYNYLDTSNLAVAGTVFLDTLDNCSFDAGEPRLSNWAVKVIGLVSGYVYEGETDVNGAYTLPICASDTAVEISLVAPYNFGQDCPTVYERTLTPGFTQQDIPVKLEDSCPLLSVDLSTNRIRPCFPGRYEVSYCNVSIIPVEDARVEVTLDTFLNFSGASLAETSLGGNVYSFEVGDLAPGHCGMFYVDFTVSCEPPLGLTHCTEAHIFPDSICNASSAWSGAWLQASGACAGDSVRLSLTNIGDAAMAAPLEFVIVEDLVMYMTQPFQLDIDETRTVTTPANGATWRIESPQESFHPWGGIVAAFVEGCGGLSQSGASLAFPLASVSPFGATECQVSVSSFDPNDKQATPVGYGPQRQITPETELEYTIRFQNTGTDTAYTVVILDTLSTRLDPASVVSGAGSHPYDFDLLGGNVLRFRFDSIRLPDSSANLLASQGFVKYRVRQQPNNPDGAIILNNAAIYFDNNAPVLTGYTYHQVGTDFLLVGTAEAATAPGDLRVYPNPAAGDVWLEWSKPTASAQLVLSDARGQTVRVAEVGGNRCRFERGALLPGVYYLSIRADGGTVYAGKIVLK